jgi:nicotinamide mononucleotide transporter
VATIEIIGAIISLLYLRLEYKANIWLWPVGVITPLIYIYIFFVSKFYAIMGINVYYLFACIYGWYCWKKNASEESGSGIARLPRRVVWKLFSIFAGLFVLIAWLLARYTDSPVPYGDALTSALSIVAMWMLAHKYAEQWLVWLVANSISAGLYFWMGLYPTSILFLIYAIVSIFGYRKWIRLIDICRGEPTCSPNLEPTCSPN